MRKNDDDSQQPSTSDGVVSRSARSSFRALSNCLRAISSGASSVAHSAASAASSALNQDIESLKDQLLKIRKVLWAGFDKLEKEDGDTRRVLLLAFQSGYQVWDVEDTENVHLIVSANDGHASFMQMLPNPIISEDLEDMFSESRPLLAVCAGTSWKENSNRQSASDNPETEPLVPTNVHVYSLKSQSYVHTLKFRSIIYTVRCSSRIVAVLQTAQIHCFDAKTLVEEYTIATNSIADGSLGVGYGPLAVGPRWIAYSGRRIAESSSKLFTSELVTMSSSPSVTQFARESSRQIASGIVSLGGRGYRSMSKFCSEALPNPYIPGFKGIKVAKDKAKEEDIGMVIIKDTISRSVIAQFSAHENPITALSFDPSGMLLVTASINGHNINVFRIVPRTSTRDDSTTASFVYLFQLQRGFTNAVIQDISIRNDSRLIVVSSHRGTSHLFEINPEVEGNAPVTLSAVKRIRPDNVGGWIGTVSGAAAAAAGMVGDSLPGAISSNFCYCVEQNKNSHYGSAASDNISKRDLLVFAPSGWMTQYALKAIPVETAVMMVFDFESGSETVEAESIRSWYMIQDQSRREMEDQQSGEESWKVTKKGKDKHQMYVSETELQMYQPSQIPLWGRRNVRCPSLFEIENDQKTRSVVLDVDVSDTLCICTKQFRFQELVLDVEEESNGGGGEMEMEGIQTRTIEARTRELVPVWGYTHSPRSQQAMRESPLQSPRNTTQGDQVAPLADHGTESELKVVHSKEESSRSEGDSSIAEEETQSKPVNSEEDIVEEKNHTEEE